MRGVPALWPEDTTYCNAMMVTVGNKLVKYSLPAVHSAVELFALPSDHVAYGKGNNLGECGADFFVALSFWQKGVRVKAARVIEADDVIGFYAARIEPEKSTPFNAFTMDSDDGSGLIFNAYDEGNEMRCINSPDGTDFEANVVMCPVEHVKNAPDWVTARPIRALRAINAGMELFLDYGDAYWLLVDASRFDSLYWGRPNYHVGAIMELDMDAHFASGMECSLVRLDYAHGFEPVTICELLPQPPECVTVSLMEDPTAPKLIVNRKTLLAMRGPISSRAFEVGEKVEVWGEHYRWWKATVVAKLDGEYLVKPTGTQDSKQQLVDKNLVRFSTDRIRAAEAAEAAEDEKLEKLFKKREKHEKHEKHEKRERGGRQVSANQKFESKRSRTNEENEDEDEDEHEDEDVDVAEPTEPTQHSEVRSASIATGNGKSFTAYLFENRVWAISKTMGLPFSISSSGMRKLLSRLEIKSAKNHALRDALGAKGKTHFLSEEQLVTLLRDRIHDEHVLNNALDQLRALSQVPHFETSQVLRVLFNRMKYEDNPNEGEEARIRLFREHARSFFANREKNGFRKVVESLMGSLCKSPTVGVP